MEEADVSLLIVAPEVLSSAAAYLQSIGSAVNAANAAAAVPITTLAAAGADEISGAVTAAFAGYGQQFQTLAGQAAALVTSSSATSLPARIHMRPPRAQ